MKPATSSLDYDDKPLDSAHSSAADCSETPLTISLHPFFPHLFTLVHLTAHSMRINTGRGHDAHHITSLVDGDRNTLQKFVYYLYMLIFSKNFILFSQHGHIFVFSTASSPTLEPTQPPIQWVPRALTLAVKQQDHEADHSPPFSAEIFMM
jgi:hypothetical protein